MHFIRELLRYSLLTLFGIPAVPFILLATLEKWLGAGETAFRFGSQALALIPGRPGNFTRAAYYSLVLERFHPSAIISFGSYFSQRGSRMGYKAGMGSYCVIGLVDIGAKTRIASRVSIVSGLHEHGSAASFTGGDENDGHSIRVQIGAGSWIAEGATIGADVGEAAIVGLGAVVVRAVPDHGMAMGNPARLLPRP